MLYAHIGGGSAPPPPAFNAGKVAPAPCPSIPPLPPPPPPPRAPNDGGSAEYYELPEGATELQDLIEYKRMNFAVGNMFKACYRLSDETHSNTEREINKILWFAKRELSRVRRGGGTPVDKTPALSEWPRETNVNFVKP
jgi:hypothetical protein